MKKAPRTKSLADAATPLCFRCAEEVDPLAHYCPRCNAATGVWTIALPVENIPACCEFYAAIWKKAIGKARLNPFTRVALALLALLSLFIGPPRG